MCFPGGPVLSETKRDRARHAQHAERSGRLQGGLGAESLRGVRGAEPPGKFCENRGVLKQFQQYRRTKNRKTVVPEIQ